MTEPRGAFRLALAEWRGAVSSPLLLTSELWKDACTVHLLGCGLCSGCNGNTGEKCRSVGSVKTPANSLRCLVGLEEEEEEEVEKEEEEGRDRSGAAACRAAAGAEL